MMYFFLETLSVQHTTSSVQSMFLLGSLGTNTFIICTVVYVNMNKNFCDPCRYVYLSGKSILGSSAISINWYFKSLFTVSYKAVFT